MNLVLRMIEGPAIGSCRVLQLGQRATVGPVNSCHWVIEDAELRGLQFRFGCSRAGCWVEDLSEAPRLLVNGLPAGKAGIGDGDIISLGRCCFVATVRDRNIVAATFQTPALVWNEICNSQDIPDPMKPPRRRSVAVVFRRTLR